MFLNYFVITLEGSQYYKEKVVTQEQISGIRKTLELYKAMGGQY
jgi:hypothetical protein